MGFKTHMSWFSFGQDSGGHRKQSEESVQQMVKQMYKYIISLGTFPEICDGK